MNAVIELGYKTGKKKACAAFGVSRAGFYRYIARKGVKPCRVSPLRLSEGEEQRVLDAMYRILARHQEVCERRRQVRHTRYTRPELLADAPNQVWSWDITRLKGLSKWTYFQLYVIMDIFSRYVVGWMVAHREHSVLAKRLIEDSCCKQKICPDQLTLHADRGSSMRSKLVSELLCDLKVARTHSRPHVSNDNPYSEAQFKTLKYCPDFPERFGSIEDARIFCRRFFDWYNKRHRHSGIGFLTPDLPVGGQGRCIMV